MKKIITFTSILEIVVLSMASQAALATCDDIVAAYTPAVLEVVGAADNGGYGLPMWVAAVDETGKVCGIVNTLDQGPLSAIHPGWVAVLSLYKRQRPPMPSAWTHFQFPRLIFMA